MGLWAFAHSPNICLFIFSNIYYYVDLLIGVAMKLHLKPDVQTFKDASTELDYKLTRYNYLRKLQQRVNNINISPGIEESIHTTFKHSINNAICENCINVASNTYVAYPKLNQNNKVNVNELLDVIPCNQCGSSGTLSILEDHDIVYISCPTCNGAGLLTRDFLEKRYQSLIKLQHDIHQSLTELQHKIETAKS